MSKGKIGFRWIWLAGFALWLGCSDEPATPSSGSAGSGGESTAIEAPTSADSASLSSPSSEAPLIAETPTSDSGEISGEELIAAGRAAYNANCIACHSLDPNKDGALGPAVAGSSLALLEARVLRVEYPAGYTPKRMTRVMVPLPHLEPRLVELAAYLDSL